MLKVKLGKKALKEFAYKIEDHKGKTLKEGGSSKGKALIKNK